MTYENAIQLLINDKSLLGYSSTIFEAWLDTTLEHLVDIYSVSSIQYQNFHTLRHEFKIKQITSRDLNQTTTYFGNRASQQISGFIESLKRERNLHVAEQQEAEKKKQIEDEQEKKRKGSVVEAKVKPIIKQSAEPIKKLKMEGEKKHYTIGIVLFWTVAGLVITAMGFLYFLGNENGKAKFDQDKINMFEKNKILEGDLSNSKDSIRLLLNSVDTWKTTANKYFKSLTKQQKDSLEKASL